MANRHRPDYVLGIDPGGSATGLCLRNGEGELLAHSVLTRRRNSPITDHIRLILEAVDDLVEPDTAYVYRMSQAEPVARLPLIGRPNTEDPDVNRGTLVIAAEDIVDPNPHLGITALRGLLDTALVLGGILGRWPDTVLVRPGRHGSQPLPAYPPQLAGPRESIGTGILRHARSAYDIAGAAGMFTVPPFGVLPRHTRPVR